MTLLDDPVAVAAAPLTPAPAHRRWERYALLALLAATAVLYVWGLSSSGWANNFYAAAVQAGTHNAVPSATPLSASRSFFATR